MFLPSSTYHQLVSFLALQRSTFKLLPLVIELVHFCKLVPIQPVDRLNNCILNLLLVSLRNHVISLLIINSASHLVRIIFQGNLGIDPLLVLFVLGFVLLSLYYHFINLYCGQPSLEIGNSDTVLLTSGLILRRDIQDAIDINIKADTEFWDTPWCRWNPIEIKFTQIVVICNSCSFTLVHSKPNTSLVVICRRETLLHLDRNWCVPWNYKTHFTSYNIHSKRQRCDIQKRYLMNLTIQDGSLDSSTIGNSLVLVDTLAKFLTMEEIL
ncbi:hypothetical protein RJ640_009297 [Escallonia rubra]|uniref:Uncharacterized protein n=1 Tax=Escallonia rubra TaxID=112253 RepID=A0AA88UCF1_9ASTE|nr:hypothetical protein RJ640_009297 [Escallonia rubra]